MLKRVLAVIETAVVSKEKQLDTDQRLYERLWE